MALQYKRTSSSPDARRARLPPPLLQQLHGLERRQFLFKPHNNIKKFLPLSPPLTTDLLDFTTPRGLRLHTASYSAEQFTAAATLSALPILDGSLAYTYTSKPLTGVQGTSSSALIDLVQGFREIPLPRAPDDVRNWEIWQAGRRVDFRGSFLTMINIDSLYYGRMYFPSAKLEGMHIRRISPAWQYIFSFVSDQRTGRGSAVFPLCVLLI